MISFLSWNLAMFERSAQAPLYWDQDRTEAVVRETVLEVAPDIVLYQELPGLVPFVETHEMIRANPRSHSGNLATLVASELMATGPTYRTVDGFALLTTFAGPELTVANVHLAAGKGAADQRLLQLSQVIDAGPTPALLIVGDTNMRAAEAAWLLEGGFSGERPPRPTWDSRRNRFREPMPEFTAYFTRWFASPGLQVSEVAVHDRPVQHDGHSFHVSDHFGLSGVVDKI